MESKKKKKKKKKTTGPPPVFPVFYITHCGTVEILSEASSMILFSTKSNELAVAFFSHLHHLILTVDQRAGGH